MLFYKWNTDINDSLRYLDFFEETYFWRKLHFLMDGVGGGRDRRGLVIYRSGGRVPHVEHLLWWFNFGVSWKLMGWWVKNLERGSKKKIGQTHLLAISFSENEKKSSQNNSLCIYILFWASKVEKTAWKMTSLK